MAAAPSSLGEQFHAELTCSICLQLFTRPKVLPCQHTFCQDCLQDHARRGWTFQCPNCRQQVTLPHQGVAGLPDNLMAANMCESLKKQTTSGDLGRISNQGDQALITKGKKILGTYTTFIQGLREKEETLKKEKQQITNTIGQAYNQMVQRLRERKDNLLADAEKQHRKNIKVVQDRLQSASVDVNELSAACNQAEQEMKQGGRMSSLSHTSQVIRKYEGKPAPTPVQTQPVVFQPTDTPVPVLGHVTVQSLPSAPIWTAPVAGIPASTPSYYYQNQSKHKDGRVTINGNYCNPPSGVAVSEEGEIFVADRKKHRVQVFTLKGAFVREVSTVVSGGQEMEPHDLAPDGEGNLWVVGRLPGNYQQYWSAGKNKQKQKPCTEFAVQYDKQGKVLRKFDLANTEHDRAIAVDTMKNHILITQTIANPGSGIHGTVQVFTPEKKLKTVGQHQAMEYPKHITVDWEGNILVSDHHGHAVYVYNKKGAFLRRFGDEGRGEGQLHNPCGICTDRAGNIIVAAGNRHVEMFDREGKFIRHVITEHMHIGEPLAVAMAPQGQLVVTAMWNNKVTIFSNY